MSTLKMSWGTRIALIYLGFVALIVALVAGAMRQSFNLVSDNYYEQELKYQQVIDASKNQSLLSSPASFEIGADEILIRFPEEFNGMTIRGDVQFYSPVSVTLDKTIAIVSEEPFAVVKRKGLANIIYTAKLSWTAGDKAYYQETKIDLSK